jgi:hypothetical protein
MCRNVRRKKATGTAATWLAVGEGFKPALRKSESKR